MSTLSSLSSVANAATTSQKTASSAATLSSNFDTFLTLLTTQLQNQDPMEPMDSSEFTNQLVQYSTVEQSIQQNANLEKLIGMFQTQGLNTATSYIGKEVTALTDMAYHSGKGANWIYSLESNADSVNIIVKDAEGKTVYSGAGKTGAGEHNFAWGGLDKDGNPLPEGFYTMEVTAKMVDGTEVASDIYLRDKVTSVEVNDGEPVLVVGGMPVTIDKIAIVKTQSSAESLTAAAGYLGKTISAETPLATFDADGAAWIYDVGDDATQVTLTIKNSAGATVHETTGIPLPGDHKFTWDGSGTYADGVNGETYTLEVKAKDINGVEVTSTVRLNGTVERIEMQNGSPVLIVDGTPVRMDQVTKVNNA
ncbi:FlgD immunoglobulin-like domain containing protein [Pedomonas mirosovicensis]|uniref:FlgD immunoglobulin-like domain containing protein n=1 Tax=Pedomonas mirosovicensis TaxID=2908641 RepID=UPI0021681C42|nr:FlgD immunoglobulin-like domain containing protein [Pedomonas mirosovicensis]MCH8685883.1 hypothetical protein [Pedomonas mirosovicensis]